ncbi:MAG: branched-chain amino acid ABC transporter permease [Armatimonadetes bacterium]|nr:branched-chain amino acid ABC transporter permease [Armatimonadota bacterium]
MQAFLQTLIYGVETGAIYALIALGYTMVYGVLRLINFAHGDVYMIGAFVGFYACTQWLPFKDLSQHPEAAAVNIALALITLFLSMLLCALLGITIERFAYRPLRNGFRNADAHFWGFVIALPVTAFVGAMSTTKRQGALLFAGVVIGFIMRPVMAHLTKRIKPSSSRLNALITAIGVSLILENGGINVFGADPKFIPDILPKRQFSLLGVEFNSSRLIILIIAAILMAVLRYIVLYTRPGKAMRAISHDIDAAKLMGINTDRVISFTFALGASLAGAAGFMVAAFTNIKVVPLFGLQPGLKAFVAAVLGGAGNIPGAALGGLIMGVVESLVASRYPQWRDAVAFILLIVILLVRPAGLLGKNTAEKV